MSSATPRCSGQLQTDRHTQCKQSMPSSSTSHCPFSVSCLPALYQWKILGDTVTKREKVLITMQSSSPTASHLTVCELRSPNEFQAGVGTVMPEVRGFSSLPLLEGGPQPQKSQFLFHQGILLKGPDLKCPFPLSQPLASWRCGKNRAPGASGLHSPPGPTP